MCLYTYLFNGDILKKTKLFFINGFILTFNSFITKCIGMAFNIYISNKIGSEAIGVFGLLMSVYMLAIVLSTSGFNLSCTRIVSEEISNNRISHVLKTLRHCIFFSLILGIGSSIIILLSSNIISQHFLNNVISSTPIRLIAIGLPFISISSILHRFLIRNSQTF